MLPDTASQDCLVPVGDVARIAVANITSDEWGVYILSEIERCEREQSKKQWLASHTLSHKGVKGRASDLGADSAHLLIGLVRAIVIYLVLAAPAAPILAAQRAAVWVSRPVAAVVDMMRRIAPRPPHVTHRAGR